MKNRGTALITGGAKRIGREICLQLAREGYAIALHYHRSFKEAQQTAQEIKSQDGICKLFPADLTDNKDIESLIKKVTKAMPDLNLLINSASLFRKSSLQTFTTKLLEEDLAIHVKAPLILSRDFSRVCQEGQIINMLDTYMVNNVTPYFTYLLSKKALHELTKMLAVELAPNIRVNAIAPGFILPPAQKIKGELVKKLERIPLRKKGNPKQIVQCIKFFLEHSYITGQVIFCDGGEHLI